MAAWSADQCCSIAIAGAGGSARAATTKMLDAQIASAVRGGKRVRIIDHASEVSMQGSWPAAGSKAQ
jgi:shikimate 5-dehydrogenase